MNLRPEKNDPKIDKLNFWFTLIGPVSSFKKPAKMADDGGFAPPPTGQKLVALHKCVQGCPAQQQFQPSFPGQAQFPGQTAIALSPPPPIGKVVLGLLVGWWNWT